MERLDLSKEWIPVERELPTEEDWYLVSVDPYYMPPNGVELIDIFYWNGKEWVTIDFDDIDEKLKIVVKDDCPVIAWMPLPKPCLIWDEKTNQRVKPI